MQSRRETSKVEVRHKKQLVDKQTDQSGKKAKGGKQSRKHTSNLTADWRHENLKGDKQCRSETRETEGKQVKQKRDRLNRRETSSKGQVKQAKQKEDKSS